MSRNPVHVRDARPDDAAHLVTIWSELSRRSASDRPSERPFRSSVQVDAENAVARIAADPDQRLLVATYDDVVVGAAHLIRAPVSPISTENAIHVTHLHVLDTFRRHGVGRALMEATVTWAEEKDTAHVLAASSAHSRDANRFMARLGLVQIAVVRGAAVSALRAKLPVEPPAAARVGSRSPRSVGHVIAQRRSQRRARARAR